MDSRLLLTRFAKWFDVALAVKKKFCVKDVYVTFVDEGEWVGWYVHFKEDVDMVAVDTFTHGAVKIGHNRVFIWVK